MTDAPARQPNTPWRHLWTGLTAFVLGLALAYAALYITKGRFLREPFLRIASRHATRPVSIGGDFQLYLNPNIKFVAEDIAVANPAWAQDKALFVAHKVDLEVSLWRLLFGEQRLRFLTVDQGALGLERDAQGRNSWSFDGKTPLIIPTIDRANITATRIHYRDDLRRIDMGLMLGDIAATAAQGRAQIGQPLTFSGGGTAMAAPFTITGSLTTPDTTFAGGRSGLVLHAQVAQTQIDVSGTLAGATRLEGADLHMIVAGRNLQTPFKLIGVTVPPTRAYRIGSDLTKVGDEFRFTKLAGRFGDSDIAGHMTITRIKDRIKLTGVLASKILDILDVGPWLGYSPAKLDAQGGKGAVTIEAGRPRILPDAPLAVEALGALDAHIQYSAAQVRTGNAPITGFYADLDLDNRLLRLAPLAFDLAGGRLAAAVLINARVRPVVTDYDFQLSQVPLGKLLKSFDVENSGATASVRGRIQLRGIGDSVRKSLSSSDGRIALVFPSGTLWIRNVQLAKLDLQNFLTAFLGQKLKKPSEIRCGLLAFSVKNGVATADPIFFDTKRAIFRGAGHFDFNDESVHLSVQGDSKEFSLFSGQSPIAINGWFAAPSINPISGKLIQRAAAGIALGVVLTPVAAILAFVDLGEQKDTDCTPVLAAAHGGAVHAADVAAEKHQAK